MMLVHAEHVWDTVVSLHLQGEELEQARDAIVAWLQHVDEVFSTFREDSVIAGWYRGGESSEELDEVLALGAEMEQLTGGLFDLGWNGRPDPTGIVKGWAVDRAVEIAGVPDLQINAGGDIRTRGTTRTWRLGITDPRNPEKLVDIVEGHDLCLATSGSQQRGAHIVTSATEVPRSASVLGPDLVRADAVATAAVAAGPAARDLLIRLEPQGFSGLLVEADGSVWASPSWPGLGTYE